MFKTRCLIVNPTYFTMFWWVDSLLPSGPCGLCVPSCLRPAVAQGSREASKNAAVPMFWPQPVPGHMELCKQKCLATIAVMSRNMFAATLTFARPKAVEGVRISIVFPYAIRLCIGKHFWTCTIMYCMYGYATKYTYTIIYILYILYIYYIIVQRGLQIWSLMKIRCASGLETTCWFFFSGKGWTLSLDRNFLIETRRWWAQTKSISGVCWSPPNYTCALVA